jgi:phosphoribosyl 1,2-cyclic phosphodiesterase
MANIASPSDARFTAQPGDTSQPGTAAPASDFRLTFWGVRGNIPAPGADTVRYGGNTACVEVRVGGHRLIFDGGTGLWVLGRYLMAQEQPVAAHLFFTHTHWDRIQGFPFLCSGFCPGNSARYLRCPGPQRGLH